MHTLLFAADGVDHCFTVIAAQCRLHGRGIGSIQLQGKINHGLQFGHHLGEHHGLINIGQTDIDVQHVYALLLLSHTLGEDVVHILFRKCLLQALFSRGVDALTDETGGVTEGQGVGIGRDHGSPFITEGFGREISDRFTQSVDIVGRSAATAAHDPNARQNKFPDLCGKFGGRNVIFRSAVTNNGQACIGLEHHGHRSAGKQFICNGSQLSGA